MILTKLSTQVRSMRLKVLSICVLLLTGACSHDQALRPEQSSGIHTIAVVCDLPDQIDYVTIGMTVFNNVFEQVDVRPFDFDATAEDALRKSLGPKYNLVFPSHERLVGVDIRSKDTLASLRSRIHTDEAVDAYLLVSTFGYSSQFINSEVDFTNRKVGVVWRINPFTTVWPLVYVNLQAVLVDRRTLAIQAWHDVIMPAGAADVPMSRRLEGFEWRENWQAQMPSEQDRVVSTIRDMLAKGMPRTAAVMGL
jgi:hypothetical protein